MSELSISIRNLSKHYEIGHTSAKKAGFAESFASIFRPKTAQAENSFYALKNLNLDVQKGDRIGIIGRNGAGKSTLLKILSRVSLPTEGEVRIKGRLTSLLEVGTGFERQASGRANIYLNAGLYGLSRREIESKFDEIVRFSGVGEFLDTPVKHYSSGMYMRLAFAIAAHLDPDILLLDEVLAVGDIAFQRKCLEKIDDLTQDDQRTVLFVSHSLGHVAQYCNKALWLNNGEMQFFGDVKTAIQLYGEFMTPKSSAPLAERNDRKGTGKVRLKSLQLVDDDGDLVDHVCTGQPVNMLVEYDGKSIDESRQNDVFINVIFMNEKKQRLFGTPSDIIEAKLPIKNGSGVYKCRLDRMPLLPGVYTYTLGMMIDNQLVDKIDDAATIVVLDGDYHGTRQLPTRHFGDVVTSYQWTPV
jgi:lipopolysaccharide transport system ATP-binding protein